MSHRRPGVDEIIVVPLASPNGVYVRLNDGSKVPVLAKIRYVFADTANVINFFGYIYNVPLGHTEPVNPNIQEQFYVDMVQRAGEILHYLGLEMLDNTEFYSTTQYTTTYTFLTHLPGYSTITLSPNSPNHIMYQIAPGSPAPPNPPMAVTYSPPPRGPRTTHDSGDNGTIRVVAVHSEGLLHVVTRTNRDVLFDKNRGELCIRGYGHFMIETTYTYQKGQSDKKYVIFKSHNQYIHVRKNRVRYESLRNANKSSNQGTYDVKVIKLRKRDNKYKSYYDIIDIIDQELDN